MSQQAVAKKKDQAPPPAKPLIPIQKVIENIKIQFPEEATAVEALARKDIISLATDEAFALRDADGEIRAFKQVCVLSSENGGLNQPVPGGDWSVSAQGYEIWAEKAGATGIPMPEVLVDGKKQNNPYVTRDKFNKVISVHARQIAFMFSSKGIPMVVDWTTIYDVPAYRMIDLVAKSKKFPQAFRLLPIDKEPSDKGDWAKYPCDEATNLWLNTAHDEALTWLGQILNREKKALDFAQTFVRRNAFKHLSGIQKSPYDANTRNPVWKFPVICWRPLNGNVIKWDATQYTYLQSRLDKIAAGDRSEFKQLEMRTGQEFVSGTEEDLSVEREADDEHQADPIDMEMNGDGKHVSEAEQQVLNNLKVARTEFMDEYNAACQKMAVEPDADHDAETAGKIMAEINSILDSK